MRKPGISLLEISAWCGEEAGLQENPPPHTCQFLCAQREGCEQLDLVFLGFSPWSFPAGPARGRNLESSEVFFAASVSPGYTRKDTTSDCGNCLSASLPQEKGFWNDCVRLSSNRNQGTLEKWLTPGLGQDVDMISPGTSCARNKESS